MVVRYPESHWIQPVEGIDLMRFSSLQNRIRQIRNATRLTLKIAASVAVLSIDATAQRTLNVEQYLINEKGVDPSRIELRTGDTPGRSVNDTLVPAGENFDSGSTATFDGASVKRRGQAYDKVRAGKTTR
jgi:hypothetical protein